MLYKSSAAKLKHLLNSINMLKLFELFEINLEVFEGSKSSRTHFLIPNNNIPKYIWLVVLRIRSFDTGAFCSGF